MNMYKLIIQLFKHLNPYQRKRYYSLQLLMIVMAILEIVGIASILPFMALVGDSTLLYQDTLINKLYLASGSDSASQFLFFLGIIVLLAFSLSSAISMFTLWKLSMFANAVGAEIANRLYSYYLKQDWLFHSTTSSAKLTKKIATDTHRITQSVLLPLMHMNAKLVLVLFISSTLFFYDPVIALFGLITFSFAYMILYRIVRASLHNNGNSISQMNEQRFHLKNEAFGGIKDILLLGRDRDLIDRFNQSSRTLAKNLGANNALAHAPRYFMELVAFGSMILLVLYLISVHDNNLGMVLPIISLYALAGLKLLPALQHIYSSVAMIKANLPAFESIRDDLSNSHSQVRRNTINKEIKLPLKNQLLLNNVSFRYPGKPNFAIQEVNLSIEKNSLVGIVGSSGAGKTTLIDILLGLIVPQSGSMMVDEVTIDSKNRRSWQNTIGYVAQNIFLSDSTIAENIALGINKDDIDFDRVQRVIELSYLDKFVKGLKKGKHSIVGERGVQLSGGQRQRIGIARALYNNAEILIFDEATSSLDGVTEKLIMESIINISGKKTILIIAHRLNTVKNCNKIFLMEKGTIIDDGTYEKLMKTNKLFQNMAAHA